MSDESGQPPMSASHIPDPRDQELDTGLGSSQGQKSLPNSPEQAQAVEDPDGELE